MMTKIYMAIGGVALLSYLTIATRGVVFSSTDERPPDSVRSGRSSPRRPGGGFFIWGVGGYRGGK